MSFPLTPSFLLAVALVVAVAGTVNGVAGFGFAVVGTMALATLLDPATAVVFMIVPILAANLSLVDELSGAELRSCGRRFAPLLVAATVGTLLGMVLLDRLPEAPLRLGLGVVTLAFVAVSQRVVPIALPSSVTEPRFAESPGWMAAIGGVSGVLFGATNVGVQIVAYVRSRDLSHGVFVGVVALVFLGVNGVRVVAAGALGLYSGVTVAAVSVAAAVPAAAGVAVGKRLRPRLGACRRRGLVFGLLTVIGVRLVLGGLGIV
ncbi:sulfite exporter TauE/SafE family protein [Halorubrum sp. DTA98]|uniref:sulfite exporter TauE/SafE family protein n=1 Tax=Halorubrum sp. DTA98 TaxID=3402163 RepID=UPI003AAC9712